MSFTLNHSHETLNLKAPTLKPIPYTLHPKPDLNPLSLGPELYGVEGNVVSIYPKPQNLNLKP